MIHYAWFLASVLVVGIMAFFYPGWDFFWQQLLTLALIKFALEKNWIESIFAALLLVIFGFGLFPYHWIYHLFTFLFYLGVILLITTYRGEKRGLHWPGGAEEDIASMFYAMDVLEREMNAVNQHGGQLTIAILDLDNFRRINEELGHVQGDLLLRLFGKILVRHLRPSDVATRYAGDEFLVIFPNTSGEKAQEMLDEVRIKMREHDQMFRMENLENPFSFCAGIVEYSPEYKTVRDYFRAADEALYSAKRKGKDVSIIVKKDKTLSFRNRRYWERVEVRDNPLEAVVYDQQGSAHRIKPVNMCLAGMMFFSPIKLNRGQVYDLELEFSDGEKLILDARAVWYREIGDGMYQIGVFLSHLSPQQKFFLNRKLEQIKKRNA